MILDDVTVIYKEGMIETCHIELLTKHVLRSVYGAHKALY